MENQKVLDAIAAHPATLPTPATLTPNVTPAPEKKLDYSVSLRKMSSRQLRGELNKQIKSESARANNHGVILATVLEAFLDSNERGTAPYLR